MERAQDSSRGAEPARDSAPELQRSVAQLLQRLSRPEARPGIVGNGALADLGALLEATECDALFGAGSEPPRAVSELLGQLAKALEKWAAPPGEEASAARGLADVAERAAAVGELMLQLLGRVEAAPARAAGLRPLAAPVYVFAATHRLQQPWSSPRSRCVAEEVLSALLRVAKCGSVAGFLCGESDDETGRFAAVMGLLRPHLSKESWKNNPAVRHVFSWTLQQVTRPWLSQHLERVLPPSLLISDDYQTENKVLGVQCLHHIVINVPAADLLQYNRAQVLYHALLNHLYMPEHHLIQAVLLCLLDLFPVLEKAVHWKGGGACVTTHCHEVLQLILTHMEPEHRLLLRRTYARNLPAFVKKLEILTVRHLKRLERVIIGYLEVYDGPEDEARLKILETLKLVVQYTWPRISCRLVVLLKALLKLICDVARDMSLTPDSTKNALLQEATDCLILLDHCSQGQVKSLLARIVLSCEDSMVVSCVRKVQAASAGAPCSGTSGPCRRHEWGSCRCRHTEEQTKCLYV
ncbi:TELO2-interacting protein 2 isoform X2 [Nannospalax galili]|nr:TELO2-interacting protein 2 isoform X2 [Nannospalax galili]